MKTTHAFLMCAAAAFVMSGLAEAQTPVPPTPPGEPKPKPKPVRPGGPQIQPPRPGGPAIQPPRPGGPQIQPPRPGGPQIQPPRPGGPRPPRPPRPRPPIRPPVVIVNPGWGQHNPGWTYGRAVLYSGNYYSGNILTVRSNIPDLRAYGFDNRALSLHSRGRWQVCSKTNFRGTCINVVGSSPAFGRIAGKVSSIRYLGQ